MPRKQRRRSWGSITEKVKGKKYVLRWVENTADGRKRRCETFYGTYKEACYRLDIVHVEKGNSGKVPTVSECARTWYYPWLDRQVASKAIRKETADTKKRRFETVIEPFMGNSCIDSVDVYRTQKWLLDMAKSTAESVLTILRSIDRLAYKFVRYENRPLGPDLSYEVRPNVEKKKPETVYGIEKAIEVMWMLHGNDKLEAPYIIAAFGGARVTEAAAVKASEVEMEVSHGIRCAVFPIIRHTKSKGYDTTDDRELKNEQSVRYAVVPEPYCDRLFEIAERRVSDGVEWLCDRRDGAPLNGPMLKYYWNEFIKKHELEPIPFSNLRKSWRTYMQTDYHVPWEILEVLMGHKIRGVTGEHYFKPTREQLVSEVCRCVADRKKWETT